MKIKWLSITAAIFVVLLLGFWLNKRYLHKGTDIDQLPEDENFYKSQKIYFELVHNLLQTYPDPIKICVSGKVNEKDFRRALEKYSIRNKIEIISLNVQNTDRKFNFNLVTQNLSKFEQLKCTGLLNTFLFLPESTQEQNAIDKKLEKIMRQEVPIFTSASETSLSKNPEGQDLSYFSPANSPFSINFAVVGSKGVLKTTANSGDPSEIAVYKLNHGDDYYTTGLYVTLLSILIQKDIKDKVPGLHGINLVHKMRQVLRAAAQVTDIYKFSFDLIFSNQIGFGIVDYFNLDDLLNKKLIQLNEVSLSNWQVQDFAPVLLLNNQCPIEKVYGFSLACENQVLSGGLPAGAESNTEIVAPEYGDFRLTLLQNNKNKASLTIFNTKNQTDFIKCAGNKKFKSIDLNMKLNCDGFVKNKIYHLELAKEE